MLRINEARLLNDLRELAQIGATADGGVHRPALTDSDIAAREVVQAQDRRSRA